MKKTNKVKMGPLGTPLGNPIAYFNSLQNKRKAELKQTAKFGGLRKKDCGGVTGIPCPEPPPTVAGAGKPLGANIGIGDVNVGYSGNVGDTGITQNKLVAAYKSANNGFGATGGVDFANRTGNVGATYNNDNGLGVKAGYDSKTGLSGGVTYDKNGFKVDAGYDREKGVNAGVSYNNTIKGVPVKVGLTYNKNGGQKKKGGAVKRKKK